LSFSFMTNAPMSFQLRFYPRPILRRFLA
jgi:hypothetical protein